MTKAKKDAGETLEQVWGWVQKATWNKVALGVLAILVGLWGYLGFESRLDKDDERLGNQGSRLSVVEEDLDHLDERFDQLDKRANDIEADSKDLNRSIANAVEKGIQRGIRKAVQEINSGNT